MNLKKYKKRLNILTIFLLLATVGFANTNITENKWKKVQLTPDLNKDGKKDKVVVEYLEEGDKVYTKFTPYIENEKIRETEEKTFSRENFKKDFGEYTQKFITIFEEKNKNNIKETKILENNNLNQEIENNKFIEEETSNTDEKLPEETLENTVTDSQKNNENNKSGDIKENLIKGPYKYITYYLKEKPQNLTFNYKYSKNTPVNMDEFLFIRTAVNIRKAPNSTSAVIKKASYGQKYKVIGKVAGNVGEWYEVYIDGKFGYILATKENALKREFDWNDMMTKVEKTNKFIVEALNSKKTIYVLDDYVALGGGSGTAKDKFGNRENQSEKAFISSNLNGEFINVPDRSIMTILEENDKYIKVKIDVYGIYYLPKSSKRLLKNSGINSSVDRFIYVDRSSQNEIVIEKNNETKKWNVVTSSFVTTGKDGLSSYATPYGVFLIAYGKPVMQYTGSDNKTIVGDAKNAIRFSGGGYMHSIPSLFEPKATREQRKAATARKIGTFPESHKCIRHYDDQIKFIYDWLGNSTPGHKYGYRTPSKPTIMLVK